MIVKFLQVVVRLDDNVRFGQISVGTWNIHECNVLSLLINVGTFVKNNFSFCKLVLGEHSLDNRRQGVLKSELAYPIMYIKQHSVFVMFVG